MLIIERNIWLCRFVEEHVLIDTNKADSANVDITLDNVSTAKTIIHVFLSITHRDNFSDELFASKVLLLLSIKDPVLIKTCSSKFTLYNYNFIKRKNQTKSVI